MTVAAMNPARDLRGASGRRRKGRREGRRGVLAPKRRPTVDAAVSAQERLMEGRALERLSNSNAKNTYMRMDIVATSMG